MELTFIIIIPNNKKKKINLINENKLFYTVTFQLYYKQLTLSIFIDNDNNNRNSTAKSIIIIHALIQSKLQSIQKARRRYKLLPS